MGRATGVVMAGLAFCWLGVSICNADPPRLEDDPPRLLIGDLEPKFDGEVVTIKFEVTRLDGVAQRAMEGQAPSFVIEAASGDQKNRLSVWIEGELANVLDRLQMCAFQENALKSGTVIIAKGKLTVHKTIPNQYLFKLNAWQGFRILPVKQDK